MALHTRRWSDPACPDEGLRVLVCRFRPRGVRHQDETWDTWLKDLGPSPELLAAYQGKRGRSIGWPAYRERYLAEMAKQGELIAELAARLGRGEDLTLVCSSACTDPARCHRTLLAELIERSAPPRHR
jgi:uncharacterized protein YeaO (DUF488 family)